MVEVPVGRIGHVYDPLLPLKRPIRIVVDHASQCEPVDVVLHHPPVPVLVPASHASGVVEVAVVVGVDLEDPRSPCPLQFDDAVGVVVELSGVLLKRADHIDVAVGVGVPDYDRSQVVTMAVGVAVLGGVPDP